MILSPFFGRKRLGGFRRNGSADLGSSNSLLACIISLTSLVVFKLPTIVNLVILLLNYCLSMVEITLLII
jgi:hypothetical protein